MCSTNEETAVVQDTKPMFQNTSPVGLTGIPAVDHGQETTCLEQFAYTGITAVDELLDPVIREGGVVLVSGITGSGKTVLAGQIATQYAIAQRNVAYLTTEVDECELLARTLSCMTSWPYEDMKDGVSLGAMGVPGYLMPEIPSGNDDFTVRALGPYRLLEKHLKFCELPGFKADPLTALNHTLNELEGQDVECIVLDLLQLDGMVDGKMVDLIQVASGVMELLAQWAEGLRIPVFVFCQRNHAGEAQDRMEVKAGRVGGIAEFPRIEKLADATIELTQPNSRPTERVEGERSCYSPNRHFIVSIRGKGKIPWIPVLADFGYQRFTARKDVEPGGQLTDRDFRAQVRRTSTRKGCIKFPRECWDKLCVATRHLGTISIYVAMVLNANHTTGRLYWSEEGLGKLFNLQRPVVRRALQKLQELGLVKPVGTLGRSHCREWEIVDYQKKFQDVEVRDYVVLARNMLDHSAADLRIDNPTFAVWLRLLFETRFTPDTEGLLERGQWEADYPSLAMRLGLDLEVVTDVFKRLEVQGRIKRWTDDMWGDEIVMLPNFDTYQRMVPWNTNAINDGPSTDQRRTNDGLWDGPTNRSGRTNDGPTKDHRRTNDEPSTDQRRTIKETRKHEKPGNT